MASVDELPLITYPPDIACFYYTWGGYFSPAIFKSLNCNVTDNMINFLNLTGADFSTAREFVTIFCLNPPDGDLCSFGFCPNPDIAGPLVRYSNYIAGTCLTILTFYSPNGVKARAFWSQSLITYSLLLTCAVSLLRGELTRYHAVVLISIVCSPANVYFTGYSIRAFWSTHRLDAVLGKKQYVRRGMVFLSLAIWIAILIYAYLPKRYTKFAQDDCRGDSFAEAFFIGSPLVFLYALAATKLLGLVVVFLALPTIVVAAWVFSIIRKRKEIWPPGEPYRPRFSKVWRTIVTNYPFLQFFSVVVIPTAYWITNVEVGVLSQWDAFFTLTFGQVLAVFITVPPFIDVVRLVPALWHWFINLRWVRFITRRRLEVPGQEEMGTPTNEFIHEKKGSVDSESNFMDNVPLLEKTQKLERSDETTEYDTLLDDDDKDSMLETR